MAASLVPSMMTAVNAYHDNELRVAKMNKKILKFSNKEDLENLRRISVEIMAFDHILEKWSIELMEVAKANSCYGVALPQIGINIRMVCIEIDKKLTILINPKIVEVTGGMKFEERCLSFPGLAVKTTRPSIVTVQYQDIKGIENLVTLHGAEAICIQHEINHLDGILLPELGALYRVK